MAMMHAQMLSVGDRVRVKGKPHEEGQTAGTIALVSHGPAYGIRFDAMADDDMSGDGIHRWYVGDELEAMGGGQMRSAGALLESRRDLGFAVRSYEFDLRSVGRGGRRLVGTVAVFNKRTRIPDRNGDFEEEVQPGFADRSLREFGMPVMQFDHGKDPRVGTVPIGKYDIFGATRTGYDVEGDLFDNAVVEPVRQAIEHRAIKGMSFRFKVTKGGDRWERRGIGIDLRQVIDADVPEAGPVVFPAYRDTAVAVRSLWAALDPEERAEMRQLAGLSTDLTGVPSTWSGGRGEPDAEPREGDASPSKTGRARALALYSRPPITLP